MIENSELKAESLKYLAGYIAWQLKRKGKGIFGTPTSQCYNSDALKDSWIHMLSRGGLLIPNDEIYYAVLNFNTIFERNVQKLLEKADI